MNHHDLLHCFSFDKQDFAVNSRTMIASRISRESAAYLCGDQSPQAFESLSEKSKTEIDGLVVKLEMTEQETSSEPQQSQDPEGKSNA
ncbi:MAG: hypothetical protein HGB11_11295 [Chlorobiales bacterium]|nr:hypothetical protein [Chlorobiales bacterium]